MEACAEIFSSCLEPLRLWLKGLPQGLQIRRRRDGTPYSTERTALDIESNLPLWLQRQRLFLELHYHKIQTSLHRFFLNFYPFQEWKIPQTEGHMITCFNHAMTITSITRQVLSETTIIIGGYDLHYFQWDATMSLLGFKFACTSSSLVPAASSMLDAAVSVFEILGKKFSAATRAAHIVHELQSNLLNPVESSSDMILGTAMSSGTMSSASLTDLESLSFGGTNNSSLSDFSTPLQSATEVTDAKYFSCGDYSPTARTTEGIEKAMSTSVNDPFQLDFNAFDPVWNELDNIDVMNWSRFTDLTNVENRDGGHLHAATDEKDTVDLPMIE